MAKKKNATSNDNEVIAKVIDLGLTYCIKQSELHIKMLEEKAKYLDEMKNILYKHEPSKLFKKSHKKWDDEIDEYNKQLRKIYSDIEFEYKEIESSLNGINGDNDEEK